MGENAFFLSAVKIWKGDICLTIKISGICVKNQKPDKLWNFKLSKSTFQGISTLYFIQWTNIEYLLCTRRRSRYQEYSSEQNRWKSLPWWSLHTSAGSIPGICTTHFLPPSSLSSNVPSQRGLLWLHSLNWQYPNPIPNSAHYSSFFFFGILA